MIYCSFVHPISVGDLSFEIQETKNDGDKTSATDYQEPDSGVGKLAGRLCYPEDHGDGNQQDDDQSVFPVHESAIVVSFAQSSHVGRQSGQQGGNQSQPGIGIHGKDAPPPVLMKDTPASRPTTMPTIRTTSPDMPRFIRYRAAHLADRGALRNAFRDAVFISLK